MKFKVWDSRTKEFIKGEELKEFWINPDGNLVRGFKIRYVSEPHFVVSFFTGQIDARKVELYGGDILKRFISEYHISTNIREVVYHDGSWRLKSEGWNSLIPFPALTKKEIQLRTNICIGNKFENPELLT